MLTEIHGTLLTLKEVAYSRTEKVAESRTTWSLTVKDRRVLTGGEDEVAESRG